MSGTKKLLVKKIDWFRRHLFALIFRYLLLYVKHLEQKPQHIILLLHQHDSLVQVDEQFKEDTTFLEKLANNDIFHVFCGHLHRNLYKVYTSVDQTKQVQIIVTSAIGCPLGDDPQGFRLVSVQRNFITHQYIAVGKRNKMDFKRYYLQKMT